MKRANVIVAIIVDFSGGLGLQRFCSALLFMPEAYIIANFPIGFKSPF